MSDLVVKSSTQESKQWETRLENICNYIVSNGLSKPKKMKNMTAENDQRSASQDLGASPAPWVGEQEGRSRKASSRAFCFKLKTEKKQSACATS
jgi:hypothetical protein